MAKKSIWALLNEIDALGPVPPDPAVEYVREAERQAREGLKSADELNEILEDNEILKEWIDRVSIPSESSRVADVVRTRVPELISYINTLHEKYLKLIFVLAVDQYNRGDTDKEGGAHLSLSHRQSRSFLECGRRVDESIGAGGRGSMAQFVSNRCHTPYASACPTAFALQAGVPWHALRKKPPHHPLPHLLDREHRDHERDDEQPYPARDRRSAEDHPAPRGVDDR